MAKRAKSIKSVMGPLSWLDSERGKKRGGEIGGKKKVVKKDVPCEAVCSTLFLFTKKKTCAKRKNAPKRERKKRGANPRGG